MQHADGTKKITKPAQNPLFEKRPKSFGIGELNRPKPFHGYEFVVTETR